MEKKFITHANKLLTIEIVFLILSAIGLLIGAIFTGIAYSELYGFGAGIGMFCVYFVAYIVEVCVVKAVFDAIIDLCIYVKDDIIQKETLQQKTAGCLSDKITNKSKKYVIKCGNDKRYVVCKLSVNGKDISFSSTLKQEEASCFDDYATCMTILEKLKCFVDDEVQYDIVEV